MGIRERKEREKERRKMHILVAAKRVFFEKGFGRTTMEDIATRAELSAGTLYLYFKNKQELYASLTLRVLQYLNIRLDQLHNENESDERIKIRQIKDALLDVYEFDPLILRGLFMLQSGDILKQLSSELVDEITSLGKQAMHSIAQVFRQAIQQGVCLDQNPSTIADVVWSIFSGVVMLEYGRQAIDPEQDLLKPTMDAAFDIFEKGILIENGDMSQLTGT